jgi:ribonuclease HI
MVFFYQEASTRDPEEAELRASRRAINLLKRLKLTKVIMELDSSTVVPKLNSHEVDRSVHGILVEETKKALREVDDHVVKWVRRSANGVAHK